MNYDVKVPSSLKREQQWFGSIIGRPIDEDSRMDPISPSGKPMELEAAEHINPSHTMRPAQRIQIYNQQYWWRLLNTLHDAFPMLTRLFGYYHFNRSIAIPYLVKYPPSHWSLNMLGESLAQWLQEEYHGEDKTLIYDAAQLDWAFNYSFIVGQFPPLSFEQMPSEAQMEEMLSHPLYSQPHLNLFRMEHELFDFKMELMKHDPDYWQEHGLPKLKNEKIYFFVLYRNVRNELSWKDISAGEYHLLSFFKKGATVEQACEWLEEQQDASVYEDAMNNLQSWFQEWSQRGWLSLSRS